MLRHLPHGTQTVRSSATYRGDPAPHQAYLTEVSFTNVQYKVVKIREGRGKNTTTRDLARVTGDFRILASSTAGVRPSMWVGFHTVDMTNPAQPVYFEGTSRDDDGQHDLIEGLLQRDLDVVPVGPMTIHLAVDYVFPTRDASSWAYDPGQNTNAGFFTDANPARSLGDASPTAFSAESTVTCR